MRLTSGAELERTCAAAGTATSPSLGGKGGLMVSRLEAMDDLRLDLLDPSELDREWGLELGLDSGGGAGKEKSAGRGHKASGENKGGDVCERPAVGLVGVSLLDCDAGRLEAGAFRFEIAGGVSG